MASRKGSVPKKQLGSHADKLAEVNQHVNELRAALFELADEMNAKLISGNGAYREDASPWPYAEDTDDYVLAMKRVRDLARIAYAFGTWVRKVNRADVREFAFHTRIIRVSLGDSAADANYPPAGKRRSAEAKDRLVKDAKSAVSRGDTNAKKREELLEMFVRWFWVNGYSSAETRALTNELELKPYLPNFRSVLQRAIDQIDASNLKRPEKVIETVWAQLGASPNMVRNLFSYKNKRAKRQTSDED